MLRFKTVLSRWQRQYLQVVDGKPHVFLNADETIDFATGASYIDDMREVTCQGNKDPIPSSADSSMAMEEVTRDANHQHAPVKEIAVESPFEISAQTINIKIVMKGAESFMLTIPAYLFYNGVGEYCDDNTAQEIIFTEVFECVPYMMLEFQDSYPDIIANIQEQLLFMFMYSGTRSALHLAVGPVRFHLLETNVKKMLAIYADYPHLTLDLSASLACDPPLSDEYIIVRKKDVDGVNASSNEFDDHGNEVLSEDHHGEFYDSMPLKDQFYDNDESNQYGDETVHEDICGIVQASNPPSLPPESKGILKRSTKVVHKATIYFYLQLPNEWCDRLLLPEPLETIAKEKENRATMKPLLSYDIADDPKDRGYTYLTQMLCKNDDKERFTLSCCSPAIVLSTDPQALPPDQTSLLLLLSLLPYQSFLEMPIVYLPQRCSRASMLAPMSPLPEMFRLLLILRPHSPLPNPAWTSSSNSAKFIAAATSCASSDNDFDTTMMPLYLSMIPELLLETFIESTQLAVSPHDVLIDLTSSSFCPVFMSRQNNLKSIIRDLGDIMLMIFPAHMKLQQFPPLFRALLSQASSLRSLTLSSLPQLQLLLPSHLLFLIKTTPFSSKLLTWLINLWNFLPVHKSSCTAHDDNLKMKQWNRKHRDQFSKYLFRVFFPRDLNHNDTVLPISGPIACLPTVNIAVLSMGYIENLTADCNNDIAPPTIRPIVFLATARIAALSKRRVERMTSDKLLFLTIYCPDCHFDLSDLFTREFDLFGDASSVPNDTILDAIFHSSCASLFASTSAIQNQVRILELLDLFLNDEDTFCVKEGVTLCGISLVRLVESTNTLFLLRSLAMFASFDTPMWLSFTMPLLLSASSLSSSHHTAALFILPERMKLLSDTPPFLSLTNSTADISASFTSSKCTSCALPMNKSLLLEQFGIQAYGFIAKLGEDSKKCVPIAASGRRQMLASVSAFISFNEMIFSDPASVLRDTFSSVLVSRQEISKTEPCDQLLLLTLLATIAREKDNGALLKSILGCVLVVTPTGCRYLSIDDSYPISIAPTQNEMTILLSIYPTVFPPELTLVVPRLSSPYPSFLVLSQSHALYLQFYRETMLGTKRTIPAMLHLLPIIQMQSSQLPSLSLYFLMIPELFSTSSILLPLPLQLAPYQWILLPIPCFSNHVTVYPTIIVVDIAAAALTNALLHRTNDGIMHMKYRDYKNSARLQKCLDGLLFSSNWKYDNAAPPISGPIAFLPLPVAHFLVLLMRYIEHLAVEKPLFLVIWCTHSDDDFFEKFTSTFDLYSEALSIANGMILYATFHSSSALRLESISDIQQMILQLVSLESILSDEDTYCNTIGVILCGIRSRSTSFLFMEASVDRSLLLQPFVMLSLFDLLMSLSFLMPLSLSAWLRSWPDHVSVLVLSPGGMKLLQSLSKFPFLSFPIKLYMHLLKPLNSLTPIICQALPMPNPLLLLSQFGLTTSRSITKLGEDGKDIGLIASFNHGQVLRGVSAFTSFHERFFDAAALGRGRVLEGVFAFISFDEMFFDAPASILREIIYSGHISRDAISSARRDMGVPIMRTLDLGGIFDRADLDCAKLEIGVLITRTLDLSDNVHLADLASAETALEGASAFVAWDDVSGLTSLSCRPLVANGVGEDIFTSND